MEKLVINIKQIVGVTPSDSTLKRGAEMKDLQTLDNGYIRISGDKITEIGSMDSLDVKEEEIIDANGGHVFPSWCDSHTHIVFAGTREGEFVDRINGLTYEQIAAKGGGILNSASKLENCSEDELFESAKRRLDEVIQLGTGAIEIKSGYGLSFEAEIKMLRVVKRLKASTNAIVKANFLGAHAIPKKYKEDREGYINLIIDEMIPAIAKENLADFIDVFCETNYYTPEETDRILKAGIANGLTPKIHVNQFTSIGGIKVGVENKALSVDHLEVVEDDDIEQLKNSDTIPTLLPSCSFFLSIPYGPAKELMKHNLPVALASDYNPGSTPSGNMNFVVSLACIKMKMNPEEAINAATLNSAAAMGISDQVGSIATGKVANLYITSPITSYNFIPYNFGNNTVNTVILKGEIV